MNFFKKKKYEDIGCGMYDEDNDVFENDENTIVTFTESEIITIKNNQNVLEYKFANRSENTANMYTVNKNAVSSISMQDYIIYPPIYKFFSSEKTYYNITIQEYNDSSITIAYLSFQQAKDVYDFISKHVKN
jgi:hypothetical protein